MPNNVRNIIKMAGIAKLPLFIEEGGEKNFDFEALIPMPFSTELESGTIEEMALEAIISKISEKRRFLPEVKAVLIDTSALERRCERNGRTLHELEEIGLQYINNLVKYGAPSWYEWRIENWGTKWNAYETKIVDDDTISFETAWNRPWPIIKKLANDYPGTVIEHWWADEDVGYNTGYCRYDGKLWVVDTYLGGCQAALENYLKCWDEDENNSEVLYRGEDGLLHYREDDDKPEGSE